MVVMVLRKMANLNALIPTPPNLDYAESASLKSSDPWIVTYHSANQRNRVSYGCK
jgi:hypothetical protein